MTVTVAKLEQKDFEQIQAFVTQARERSKLPGISVAMWVNGQTFQASAGVRDVELGHLLTPDSLFPLGCINKFVTALAVLELSARGLIDLDQPLSSYLPKLAGVNGDQALVRHLLSHSCGYQGENLLDADVLREYSYDEFAKSFNRRLMLFKPGTVFDYSHSASALLAKIVAVVTGNAGSIVYQSMIFEPLGINVNPVPPLEGCAFGCLTNPQTGQQIKVPPIPWSDFWNHSLMGPMLKLSDLVKIGEAIVTKSTIFSPSVIELLTHHVIDLPSVSAGVRLEEPFYKFGLGCAQYPTGTYGVRSSSIDHSCALRFDMEKGIVIAVGINANAGYMRDLVLNKLVNALLPEDAAVQPNLGAPVPEVFELIDLAGEYQGAQHSTLLISIEGDQLVVKQGHNPAVSIDRDLVVMKFVRNDLGHVVPAADAKHFSAGFFRDPTSSQPCLFTGGSSFIKKLG
jgi:CubicO group peptidase (beta-lactamase class C family)